MAIQNRWAESDHWFRYDDFVAAQSNTLREGAHPFLLDHDIETELRFDEKGSGVVVVSRGNLYCCNDVIAEISIFAETRRHGVKREMRVLTVVYEVYLRDIPGSTLVRYDDHGRDDWHRHYRDESGTLLRQSITRRGIPTLDELLDELYDLYS